MVGGNSIMPFHTKKEREKNRLKQAGDPLLGVGQDPNIRFDKPEEEEEEEEEEVKSSGIKLPEVGEIQGSPKQTLTLPDGRQFFGLNREDIALLAKQQAELSAPIPGTQPAGTARQTEEARAEVGRIEPSPTTPTEGLIPGVELSEAAIVGIREAIPRALTLAGGAAIAGATAGLVTGGAASIPLAVAAGAVAFTGSITSSILSNVKSQRTDDVNAQQRTLDEGKQTLQDWTTQAAADPSNRAFFISQFNSQLQLIQDAHVQMLTDTNVDVAKFETAIPNLAEFNSFYNEGGERDALISEMLRSLGGGVGDLELNFRMIEMANRRL